MTSSQPLTYIIIVEDTVYNEHIYGVFNHAVLDPFASYIDQLCEPLDCREQIKNMLIGINHADLINQLPDTFVNGQKIVLNNIQITIEKSFNNL